MPRNLPIFRTDCRHHRLLASVPIFAIGFQCLYGVYACIINHLSEFQPFKGRIMNKLSLTVVALLVCVSAYAVFSEIDSSDADSEYSGKCGDDVTYEFDSATGVLSITGSGAMYDYPYGSHPWNTYREDIIAVEITGTVTSVGYGAFYECISLTSVSLPETIESIGERSFYKCSSLTSVTIGGSVESIANNAFQYCTSLTSVTVSDSVKTIGYSAFSFCTSLTSVTLGSSVESIDNNAFRGCSSLASITVNAENGTYSSADGVLFDRNKTELILYPVCKPDTAYTVPDTVKSIRGGAFYGCTSLASVTLSDSLMGIGEYAFYGCTSLASVDIPGAVDTIGYGAFRGCTTLASVTVSKSVVTLGDYVFFECPSLTSITVDPDNTNYSSADGVLFDKAKTELILYPASKTGDSYSVPDTVATIRDYAFGRCSELASVTVGDNVTSIGICVFDKSTSLRSVTLGNSLREIGKSTFSECTSLASVTLGNSVETIGDSVFFGCTSLASLTLPDTVKIIEYSAFGGCTSLASISIPKSVETIGNFAFRDCTSLASITVDADNANYSSVDGVLFYKDKTVLIQYPAGKSDTSYVIPGTVETVGEYSFYRCSNLASVTIGNSVTTLEWCAFYGCTSIVTVAIPSSVMWIDSEAFRGCTSLAEITVDEGNAYYCSVDGVLFTISMDELIQYPGAKADTSYTIPDSVTVVREKAFEACSNLVSVTVPGSVLEFGYTPFYGCASIATILVDTVNEYYSSADGVLFDKDRTELLRYPCARVDTNYAIPVSVTFIGPNAFRGCTALASVTFPASVKSISEDAFDGDFYDTDGKTKLEPTAKNLAGLTFVKAGDDWFIPVYSGKCGDDVTFDFDTASGVLVIEGSGKMYDFTERSVPWYPYRGSILSVSIGGSVTSIGSYSFYGCSELSSVTIPDSVKSIESSTFSNCTSLTSIVLSSVETIGSSAFGGCSKLAYVEFSGSLRSIDPTAFDDRFYDKDGSTAITTEASNLAGSIFKKVDGKWIKQTDGKETDDKGSNTVVYVVVGIVIVLGILALAVWVMKKNGN